MKKELIFVGLGRMGQGMTTRLVEEGFVVHGFDANEETRTEASAQGVSVTGSLVEAISKMSEKKIVWLMVPSKFVDDVLTEIIPQLSAGDIIIDGGNSFFKDTLRRNEELKKHDIHYVDCGTSGGVQGARHGASLMVGGDEEVVSRIKEIFETLAATNAYAHVGKTGAGHFVKMVHNGIEYGMMGALAEGMSFIEDHKADFDIRVNEVLKPYQHGSVIESSLMNWLADSYQIEGHLESIAGIVPQGETEPEMEFIAEHGKTKILQAALEQRKETRQESSRIGTLISAMRNQFGGHAVKSKDS